MEINFLDTGHRTILIMKNQNVELDLEDLNQLRVESDNNLPFQTEIEQLESNVLNSLNYAASQNVLPSTLPTQLNVKFLNASTFEKLKDKITPSSIAQLEDPNTLYVSTKLLPQHQQNSSDILISNLYDKFKNPQQVLDLVVFHELGHLVFNNSFSDFLKFNQDLLNNKSMLEKFRDKFLKENYESVPLYQMNRSLEEHFADSYSSMILSRRYGTKPEDYIDIRNSNDLDGLKRTTGFDININRLDDSFNKLANINYEKDGIDKVIKQIYELSLAGSKEVMGNKLRIVRNDDLLNKLQNNLTSLGINTKNNKEDVLDKAEDLIKSKADNSEAKVFPNKRMFSIPNIEERLMFFENRFSQVDSEQDFNKLKR